MSHFRLELPCPGGLKYALLFKCFVILSRSYCFEVVKFNCVSSEVKIFGVKIYREGLGCYTFSIQHNGEFNLKNYEKLELKVKSVKLVRKG